MLLAFRIFFVVIYLTLKKYLNKNQHDSETINYFMKIFIESGANILIFQKFDTMKNSNTVRAHLELSQNEMTHYLKYPKANC